MLHCFEVALMHVKNDYMTDSFYDIFWYISPFTSSFIGPHCYSYYTIKIILGIVLNFIGIG